MSLFSPASDRRGLPERKFQIQAVSAGVLRGIRGKEA